MFDVFGQSAGCGDFAEYNDLSIDAVVGCGASVVVEVGPFLSVVLNL